MVEAGEARVKAQTPSANLEGHSETGITELGLGTEYKGIFGTLGFLRIKG